jgi:2-oxo-4-hydroxy-4-carboxy-5-ureidoimidazoline decarboxylase
MTVAELSQLPQDQFVESLGWIFEDSPWVAERAWAQRPFADLDAVHAAMIAVVASASRGEQLSLLCAHPDLGSRARMSTASVGEQAGVGLDRLTPEEYARLHDLNSRYRAKFGFNFLFAVKGSTKHDILEALERRIESTPEQEFQEALQQVYRIASFRLRDAVTQEGRS